MAPRQLRLVLELTYLSFDEPTVFPFGPGAPLFGAVHPYFAPQPYFLYQGGFEWKHWLSRDYQMFANETFYAFDYRLGWDSDFNNYNTFRLRAESDVKSWLSLGLGVRFITSSVYDVSEAFAYAHIRLPRLN